LDLVLNDALERLHNADVVLLSEVRSVVCLVNIVMHM